jgi:hypothetical protein
MFGLLVGRYQLAIHVIGGEKVLQSGRCLVVECLEFWFETLCSDFLDNLNVADVINLADHDI